MMQFIKNNILPIGGAAVLLLCVFLYFTYFSGSGAPALSTTDTASPVSKELLLTISSLHTIKLDQSIFVDPVFVSLSDFGVDIPAQDVGRGNPFAPFGSISTPAVKK